MSRESKGYRSCATPTCGPLTFKQTTCHQKYGFFNRGFKATWKDPRGLKQLLLSIIIDLLSESQPWVKTLNLPLSNDKEKSGARMTRFRRKVSSADNYCLPDQPVLLSLLCLLLHRHEPDDAQMKRNIPAMSIYGEGATVFEPVVPFGRSFTFFMIYLRSLGNLETSRSVLCEKRLTSCNPLGHIFY